MRAPVSMLLLIAAFLSYGRCSLDLVEVLGRSSHADLSALAALLLQSPPYLYASQSVARRPGVRQPVFMASTTERHRKHNSRAQLLRFACLGWPASQIFPFAARAAEKAYQPALGDNAKTQMDYSDFSVTPSGLRFKVAKEGNAKDGKIVEEGDRVVLDWSGYTIGYFGRPFETKKLQELDKVDDARLRFVVGSGTVVPAIDEGVRNMRVGDVRQLVVPYGSGGGISYPESDPKHARVGPKPSTFSGYQALNFVLNSKDGLIDKTLLFNVKLARIDKAGSADK